MAGSTLSAAASTESEPFGSEELSLVRMNFSTNLRIKPTIQRAAALASLDDSSFTMQAAYQAARGVISAHERRELQGIDHAVILRGPGSAGGSHTGLEGSLPVASAHCRVALSSFVAAAIGAALISLFLC
jgi:uncharacterized protein (DUF1778 family)